MFLFSRNVLEIKCSAKMSTFTSLEMETCQDILLPQDICKDLQWQFNRLGVISKITFARYYHSMLTYFGPEPNLNALNASNSVNLWCTRCHILVYIYTVECWYSPTQCLCNLLTNFRMVIFGSTWVKIFFLQTHAWYKVSWGFGHTARRYASVVLHKHDSYIMLTDKSSDLLQNT